LSRRGKVQKGVLFRGYTERVFFEVQQRQGGVGKKTNEGEGGGGSRIFVEKKKERAEFPRNW